MKSIILVAAFAAALLGGCATTDAPPAEQDNATELVYRTGSNIPIRNAKPLTKEEKERQTEQSQRDLERAQKTGGLVFKP